MTKPVFLDEGQIAYSYGQKDPIVDVETGGVGIITELRARLVTGLSWTEPSTALFKCVVDNSRFFDVLVTRISASTIEFRIRDAAAVTICTRRLQIDTTAGSAIRYYCSAWGVVVEVLQATPELFQAFKLEVAPAVAADVSIYVIGNGYRNNSSTQDGNGTTTAQYFAIDNGTATQASRVRYRTVDVNGSANFRLLTQTGRFVFKDCMVRINYGGTNKWAGRIPHMLSHDDRLPFGCRRKPNIDTGTKVIFQTLGLISSTQNRVAMRVGEA